MPTPKTTPFQPPITLAVDDGQTDAERNFIDESPPNLFPENSDSNWGFKRKVFSDEVQLAIEQQNTIYQERFIDTSNQFIDEWETQMLVPVAPTGLDIISRRSIVKNRMKKGSLTRDRMNHLVENAILSTLGTPTQLTPDGLALDANGLTLYGEAVASSMPQYYRIYYDPSNFAFDVYVRSDIVVNAANLVRELLHFRPGGTVSGFDNSLANIRDYQRTILTDGPTGYWPLQTTFGTGFPYNSIAGLALTLTTGVAGTIPATSAALVQRGGLAYSDNGARDWDGVDDFLAIPIANALAFGTGPRTFEAWIQPDALPASGHYAPVFSWPPASGSHYSLFGLANYGTGAQFAYKAAATAGGADIAEPQITKVLPQVGTIYHIVGTWDGAGRLKFYVNGVIVADVNYGEKAWIALLGSGNLIGASNVDFFNGKIDDPAVYGNILTDAQVLRHYQTGINIG